MSSKLKNVGGKKRQRSDNWLEEDKMILKELVKERLFIIENKNTNANVNAKKVAAWHDLLNSFNNMSNTPRTLPQIKAQWGIIKMAVKKQKFKEKKQTSKTGGGPPPTIAPATCDDLTVWLSHDFTVDSNEFDSDNQYIIKENTKEKITEQPRPEKEMHDNKNIPAEEIAANEIACKKELHEIQMAVERQKLKILQHKLNNTLLKKEVLERKLLYYTNKE